MRGLLKVFIIFIAALATGVLAGCETGGLQTDIPPAAPATSAEYVLGTGDKLRVTVFGEQNLSGEFTVDGTGAISMPLVGPQRAAGLTPKGFSDNLTAALKAGYMKDPKVSVDVINHRPFFMLGEVSKPGEYPYRSGMNAVSAVATAGGYTHRANTDVIFVRRNNETQEKRYKAAPNVPVFPGDIVRVPERYF
jgi:polysaccharide export outer membrane protein